MGSDRRFPPMQDARPAQSFSTMIFRAARRANRRRSNSFSSTILGMALCPVIAAAGDQARPVAIALDAEAETIMFDFV